jgi:thiosulfate/3-mercaptopyruvate sulfurtransferase
MFQVINPTHCVSHHHFDTRLIVLIGAVSIPFSELIDPTTKVLKSTHDLRQLFLEKGIDSSPKSEKILMCGTGVTAVVVNSALELAGIEGKLRVYDGSWT